MQFPPNRFLKKRSVLVPWSSAEVKDRVSHGYGMGATYWARGELLQQEHLISDLLKSGEGGS